MTPDDASSTPAESSPTPSDPTEPGGATDPWADATPPGGGAPSPEFDVPPGASAATCAHCGRPFREERALALHLGGDHEAALSPSEVAASEDAVEQERDELFVYHAKVVTALGAIYSVTVILYMVAFGSGLI